MVSGVRNEHKKIEEFGDFGFIVVVKKTFRYPNVFFYKRNIYFFNLLCPNPLYRNIFMEKGINI